MDLRIHLIATFLFCVLFTKAQITVTPENPTISDNVTITYDATQGNGELTGVSPVYIHTGVLTTDSQNPSDWFFVKNDWPVNTPDVEMQDMGNNIHQISFQIDNYYNLPNDVSVTDLAMVFRNADGSLVGRDSDGGDIFYPIFPDNLNDDYVSHSLNGNQLVIQSTQHQYTVQAYADDILKVAFYGDNNATIDDSSKAVVLQPSNNGNVNDLSDKLVYQNGTNKVVVEKNPITFKLVRNTDTILRHAAGFFKQGNSTSLNLSISPDEAFHGSGMRAIDQNLRGQNLSIYNQANYAYDQGAKNLNFNVPFFVSTYPYGLYFDHQFPSDIAFDQVDNEINYNLEDGQLSYFLLAADAIPDVMDDYMQLTGYQPLPPRWSLGYIQSKFGYQSETETRNVVNQLQAENFPVDAIGLDLYWFGQPDEMGNLDWDNSAFPTPVDMISDLENDGVKTILITEPYITSNSTNYTSAIGNGDVGVDAQGNAYLINDFWAGTAVLLNLMDASTQDWMWNFYKDRINEGVAGWWCDLGEPENHPTDMFHNGQTAREVHNYYSLDWTKMLYEKYESDFPDQRIFNLIRSGYGGSQRYGALPWSGDINRSFSGMAAQIPIMINMGYSGLAYMHSDIGGFTGGGMNSELYTRWMQMGAFSPIMRAHGEGIPTEPTAYPQPYKDIVRSFIELRYELLPYNYSLAIENSLTGAPMVRSMDYHYPDMDGMSDINDQYLWGRDFLIAPVLTQGATSRSVVLPDDPNDPFPWIPYFDDGDMNISDVVDAPIDTMPIFVRNGAIIPHTNLVQTTDDYNADQLSFHYFKKGVGLSSYTLYNDDGSSTGTIENNQYETITVDAEKVGGFISFDLAHNGNFTTMPTNRSIEFVIEVGVAFDSAEINGNIVPVYTTESEYQNNTPAVFYDETANIIDQPKIKFNWDNSDTNVTIYIETLSTDNDQKGQMTIYPNPAKNKINIQIAESLSSWSSIELYAMNGQQVYSFENSDIRRTSSRLTLDLPKNISNGVYILKISGRKGKKSAQLIISR